MWKFQIPTLAKTGDRVLVSDLRGYGGAPRTLDKEQYAMSRHIPYILGIMDALNVDKASVAGHD